MGALLLAGAVGWVYSNALDGPFVFDDLDSIPKNSTIRNLADWRAVLSPPATGITVQGRPLVNLSLALNYARGGLEVRGYRLANVLIHLLAAWTLFGLVRRTLELEGIAPRWRERASPVALATALLWAVHPLATAAVTYVVQRAESMMTLFYLLTLYGLCRAHGSRRSVFWLAVSAGACFLGTASKEAMASAPLMALLYDRLFLSGSFGRALRRRTGYYAALTASLALAVWLVLGSGNRGGTVGLASGMGAWAYLRTQPMAILTYLRLAVWPHPLIFDYGALVETSPWRVLPAGLAVAALLAATVAALRKAPKAAFAGLLFFAVLAPTSSFIPVATQTLAEHRMYLPLAAAILLLVLAAVKLGSRLPMPEKTVRMLLGTAVGVAALLLGWTAHSRNAVYADAFRLWSDTVAKRPQNSRAWHCLSLEHLAAGRTEQALEASMQACRVSLAQGKAMAENHNNLANVLCTLGRHEEALDHYREALRHAPGMGYLHSNYGKALGALGRHAEALDRHRTAIRLAPDFALAHLNLAQTLLDLGRVDESLAASGRTAELDPDLVLAYHLMGDCLRQMGRKEEALGCYSEVLRRDPPNVVAGIALGLALLELDRRDEARAVFQETVQKSADPQKTRTILAAALLEEGHSPGAWR